MQLIRSTLRRANSRKAVKDRQSIGLGRYTEEECADQVRRNSLPASRFQPTHIDLLVAIATALLPSHSNVSAAKMGSVIELGVERECKVNI